jgi:hypothetical protein
MATPPDFSPGQVLTAAHMDAVGLWLVKTETIGSAVASVTVTDAFSADYDAYKIVITGGVASAGGNLRLQIGNATTAYYTNRIRVTASTGLTSSTSFNVLGAFDWAGSRSTDTLYMNAEVHNPFLTKNTTMVTTWTNTAATTSADLNIVGGYLQNSTSYTDFTITPSSGTLTGGTIRVYGYRN